MQEGKECALKILLLRWKRHNRGEIVLNAAKAPAIAGDADREVNQDGFARAFLFFHLFYVFSGFMAKPSPVNCDSFFIPR